MTGTAQTLSSSIVTDAGPAGLTVDDLTIRYGGNVAVADLSLTAPLGRLPS